MRSWAGERRRRACRGPADEPRPAPVRRGGRDQTRPGRLPGRRRRPRPAAARRPAAVGQARPARPEALHAEEPAQVHPAVGAAGDGVGGVVPARGVLRAVRRPPHPALVRQPARRRVPPAPVPRRRVGQADPPRHRHRPSRAGRLRLRGAGRPPRPGGDGRLRPVRGGQDQRREGRPRVRPAGRPRARRRRGRRHPRPRGPRRAPRPRVHDDGVHPRGPGRQGVPRLDPRGKRDGRGRLQPADPPRHAGLVPRPVGRPRRRRPRRLHRPQRRGPPGRPGPPGPSSCRRRRPCPRTWSRRATPSLWRGCRPCTRASAAPAPAGRGERASQGSRTTGGSRCPSFSRPSPKWRPGSPPG